MKKKSFSFWITFPYGSQTPGTGQKTLKKSKHLATKRPWFSTVAFQSQSCQQGETGIQSAVKVLGNKAKYSLLFVFLSPDKQIRTSAASQHSSKSMLEYNQSLSTDKPRFSSSIFQVLEDLGQLFTQCQQELY